MSNSVSEVKIVTQVRVILGTHYSLTRYSFTEVSWHRPLRN
jgi:hypothetical protein